MIKDKKQPIRQVYIDDDKGVLRRRTVIQKGFLIGNIEKKGLIFEMIGEPGFNETVDDMCSGLLHVMFMANDISGGKAKDEIYKRVNQAVSLILDKFNPEAKEEKFGIVSDAEILKLEEEKINKEYDSIQPKESKVSGVQ